MEILKAVILLGIMGLIFGAVLAFAAQKFAVEVDERDKAFENPTKPIGAFMTKKEADSIVKEGKKVIEDSGRGYRRVIASPKPIRIVEIETIKALIENNQVVIACGGVLFVIASLNIKNTVSPFSILNSFILTLFIFGSSPSLGHSLGIINVSSLTIATNS